MIRHDLRSCAICWRCFNSRPWLWSGATVQLTHPDMPSMSATDRNRRITVGAQGRRRVDGDRPLVQRSIAAARARSFQPMGPPNVSTWSVCRLILWI